MPRGTAAEGLTIGFLGTGSIEDDGYIETVLDEYLGEEWKAGKINVRFLVPVTGDLLTEELSAVMDYAETHEIPYETITIPTERLVRTQKKYVDGATKSHAMEDPIVGMVKLLESAQNSHLMILWDQELEEEMLKIASMGMDAGIVAHDFIDGLARLESDEEGSSEAAAPADGEAVYTTAELKEFSRDELKEIATKVGVETFPRSNPALIDAIIEAQGGEPEDAEEDEVTGEVEEADDADAGELADAGEESPGDLDGLFDGLREDLISFFEGMAGGLASTVLEAVKVGIASQNGSAPHTPAEAPTPIRSRRTAPAAAEAASEPSEEAAPAPRRRGRPPGSKNKPKEPEAAAPAPAAGRRRLVR